MSTETKTGDPSTESTGTVNQDKVTEQTSTDGEKPQEQVQNQTDGAANDGQQPSDTQQGSNQGQESSNKDALLADLHKERDRRKTLQTQVDTLTADLAKATQTSSEHAALQQKYSRLEEFLTKAGGPLGKVLDSRSFTKALFESDDDIDTIVANWNRDNPTATSQALGSGAGSGGSGGVTMNDLLRAAK